MFELLRAHFRPTRVALVIRRQLTRLETNLRRCFLPCFVAVRCRTNYSRGVQYFVPLGYRKKIEHHTRARESAKSLTKDTPLDRGQEETQAGNHKFNQKRNQQYNKGQDCDN